MFHNVWHCSRLNVWCYFWGRVFGCHWSSWTVERSNTEERSALLAWLKWLVILVIVRLTVIVTTSFSPNYIIHGIFISTSQTLNHCRQLLAIEFRVSGDTNHQPGCQRDFFCPFKWFKASRGGKDVPFWNRRSTCQAEMQRLRFEPRVSVVMDLFESHQGRMGGVRNCW